MGLDTAVFIYHIEGSPRFAGPAGIVFAELNRGTFQGLTSVLTLMELAVKPLQLGRQDIADEYEVVLAAYPHLRVVPLDRGTARRAAELRASSRLRPADVFQVAACLQHRATAFVTNDRDLRRVTGLQVILLEDFVAG